MSSIFSLAVSDFLFSVFVSSINAFYFANLGKWYISPTFVHCLLHNELLHYLIFCNKYMPHLCEQVTISVLLKYYVEFLFIVSFRCVKICHCAATYGKIFSKRNLVVSQMLIFFYAVIVPLLASLGIGGKNSCFIVFSVNLFNIDTTIFKDILITMRKMGPAFWKLMHCGSFTLGYFPSQW